MTTPTARYGLNKIVLASDSVDVVNDFNNNWDAIDLKLGSQVCTSSTRPAAPVQGMDIYETDTGATRTYSGTAWTPCLMVATSSSRPANSITGDYIYETDTGSFAVQVGSNTWRYRNVYPCTSSTRPTNVGTGATIYESDTKRLLVNNSGTWENKAFANYVCTSSTHPSSPFQGLEIFETDTGLNAVYNGSGYLYGMGQVQATQVLGATTASVTFSSLPALNGFIIKWAARCSDANAAEQLYMRFNGDTGANYDWEVNQANNTTVAGTTGNGATFVQVGTVSASSATANYWSTGYAIVNPGGTGQFTTVVGTGSAFGTTANMWVGVYGGQWNSTATVTSITLQGATGSFLANSRFSIYSLE